MPLPWGLWGGREAGVFLHTKRQCKANYGVGMVEKLASCESLRCSFKDIANFGRPSLKKDLALSRALRRLAAPLLTPLLCIFSHALFYGRQPWQMRARAISETTNKMKVGHSRVWFCMRGIQGIARKY